MFKILIVEDDTELCQLFSHVLEKNGYHTRMVSNGQQRWMRWRKSMSTSLFRIS